MDKMARQASKPMHVFSQALPRWASSASHRRHVAGGFIAGCIFEEARCEVLCENRSENGRGKHQHEDHVEQPAIEQSLTVSESTVAPKLIVIASRRVSPSRTTIGAASSVCEASSDPITTAATG